MEQKKNILMQGKWLVFITIILLVAIVAGCSGEKRDSTANASGKDDVVGEEVKGDELPYPRTVTVEDKEVTLDKKPDRIATLSLNVAEVTMELVGPESIIAVTQSMENESLSHFSEDLDGIAHKITGATSLDPEVVISYEPDLVLLTLTHGAEKDADEMLQNAGIPLASFSRWTTIEDLMTNYLEIGQLVGEEEKAKEIVEKMEEQVTNVKALVDENSEKPSILLLSQVGSNTGPYILGPSSIAYDLVNIAGGISGSDVLGLEKTAPASIEHIINIDPDFIILVEWGSTSDEYSELIESSGFKTLTAVKEGKVKQIKAKDVSQANRYIVDTLEELVMWIHGD